MGTTIDSGPFAGQYVPTVTEIDALRDAAKHDGVDAGEARTLGLTEFQRTRANDAISGLGPFRGLNRFDAVDVFAWKTQEQHDKPRMGEVAGNIIEALLGAMLTPKSDAPR